MKALDILNRLQDEQPMYFENEVTEAIAELEALEKELADMHYKFSCVIDNATGGKLSKPDYKIEAIYSAINENVSRWMQMAADEVREYELEALQEQLSTNDLQLGCNGCKWYEPKRCMNMNSIAYNGDNAVYENDFCRDYEPKDSE